MLSEETRGKADRTLKAVEETKLFNRIENRLKASNESFHSLTQRATKVADQLLGTDVEKDNGPCKSAVPPQSILAALHEYLDVYDANLRYFDELVQRLEKL